MPDSSKLTLSYLVVSRLRDLLLEQLHIFGVRVVGVEVTQAIQHYRAASHLTDPADRGMDNSVTLVANKPAWVRVYVRSGSLAEVTGVTGTLRVERRHFGLVYGSVTTLSPQPPGSITARNDRAYADERSSTSNTLNFIIPAGDFIGHMRLTVRLQSSTGDVYDDHSVTVNASVRQTMRIRAILVAYNGPSTSSPPTGTTAPNLQLAAPTLSNLQSTAALGLRMMPVQSTGSFASAGTITFTMPLDDPRSSPGGCSTNWGSLLTALANQRTADGNRTDVVYYGLLPAGVPLNVPGCGDAGLGSAAVGDQTTFVHEIGHGYGFSHTPCGAAGTTDSNYPTYEPYPSASIGEYGLDISNGQVYPPQTTYDYMSYCGPQWMSIYQHDRLVGHSRLNPEYIHDEPWWHDWIEDPVFEIPEWWLPDPPPYQPWRRVEMNPAEIISITGLVRSRNEVEIATVARVAAAGTPPGIATALRAQLIDEEGHLIAEGAVMRLNPQGGCGCGGKEAEPPSYAFQAFVPNVAPGAALRIVDADGEEVWSRRAPEVEPTIERFDAHVDDGDLHIRWSGDVHSEKTADDRPESYEVWLQWSIDEGRSWHGLATGITDNEARLSTTGLPAGEVLIRALVHDGFYSAASEPQRIEVPDREPETAILHPSEGQRFPAGRTLHLWGAASDPGGRPLPSEACRWYVDDREVGRGKEVWIESPPEGSHVAVLVVEHGDGNVERKVEFTTVDPPRMHRE